MNKIKWSISPERHCLKCYRLTNYHHWWNDDINVKEAHCCNQWQWTDINKLTGEVDA